MRPTHDLKSFPGRVIDADAYDPEALYARFEAQGNPLAMGDLVTVAPALEIASEHRFVVVGRRVAFRSTYRKDGRMHHVRGVPAKAYDFAQEAISTWLPVDSCVVDVAVLEGGACRVVEFNCLNCSGFYAASVDDLRGVYDAVADTVSTSQSFVAAHLSTHAA